MGQVFVAENLAIGQKVALKVLKPELLADATFRMRFQQEAEAIAAVEHRNVARFLDLVVGDPTFIVMEYVRGPTLAQVIRDKKRLPAIDAMYIAERLCWALEAAHQRGVVHRDIKPSNVILTPDTENEIEPKLIDFGLAKVAAASSEKGLTRTGQIVGTPDYMSPEQIANKEVDARSDVYSLGCLIFEMCVGRPPFTGGDDVQVLYQQLQVKPDRVEDHVPDAPPEIDKLLGKALAKDPAARFQSMREMAEAMARGRRRVYRSITGEAAATLPRHSGTHRVAEPSGWSTRVSWPAVVALVAIVGAGAGFAFSRMNKPAAVKPEGGAILVVTRPSGAQIEIDGKPFAESSPTMVASLGAGRAHGEAEEGQARRRRAAGDAAGGRARGGQRGAAAGEPQGRGALGARRRDRLSRRARRRRRDADDDRGHRRRVPRAARREDRLRSGHARAHARRSRSDAVAGAGAGAAAARHPARRRQHGGRGVDRRRRHRLHDADARHPRAARRARRRGARRRRPQGVVEGDVDAGADHPPAPDRPVASDARGASRRALVRDARAGGGGARRAGDAAHGGHRARRHRVGARAQGLRQRGRGCSPRASCA